jgi:uncharacterized protein YndB with AHSA1/START domain
MTAYSFATHWRAEAPIDDVFVAIADVDQWPAWWRGVRSATMIERPADARGNGDGVGTRYRFAFRSRLPYSLVFELVVTEADRPTLLVGRASGELEGTGRWTLAPAADGTDATDVTYEWNVRTTRWWMNLLGPVARPVFAWNHDAIMDWGRIGLAHRLGAPVKRRQPSSGSGSSRGAPTGG